MPISGHRKEPLKGLFPRICDILLFGCHNRIIAIFALKWNLGFDWRPWTLRSRLRRGLSRIRPSTKNEALASLTSRALGCHQVVLYLILTCSGGGFATLPAYIGDLFGTKQLGAIHGYVLSAWAMAGVFGPQIVARLYEATGSYQTVLHVFSGLFAVALAVSILMTIYMLNARNWMTGVTLFKFDGQDFVRTETNLLTADGKSAINTKLIATIRFIRH